MRCARFIEAFACRSAPAAVTCRTFCIPAPSMGFAPSESVLSASRTPFGSPCPSFLWETCRSRRGVAARCTVHVCVSSGSRVEKQVPTRPADSHSAAGFAAAVRIAAVDGRAWAREVALVLPDPTPYPELTFADSGWKTPACGSLASLPFSACLGPAAANACSRMNASSTAAASCDSSRAFARVARRRSTVFSHCAGFSPLFSRVPRTGIQGFKPANSAWSKTALAVCLKVLTLPCLNVFTRSD